MDNNIMEEFYNSYHFLLKHPIFLDKSGRTNFQDCLWKDVVKVNPETESISDIEEENTKVQVWLETGPYSTNHYTHDIDLDCGGNTFEEAIIELAKLVKNKYGDYQGEE